MPDHAQAVQDIVEDFDGLEREIRRELSGEGWTELERVMEEAHYRDELQAFRERIARLLAEIQEQLARLRAGVGHGDAPAVDLKEGVIEARDLLGRLQALCDRLDSLVLLIELRQASGGGVSAAVVKVKGWLSVLAGWMRRISSQLWSLLAKLMRPKEWKLSGKLGTGPFGLVDVGVEVTFGP